MVYVIVISQRRQAHLPESYAGGLAVLRDVCGDQLFLPENSLTIITSFGKRTSWFAAQAHRCLLTNCPKEKAARRRLLNSNLMIVDQAAINAGFDLRR
jgi:hypothetical protein